MGGDMKAETESSGGEQGSGAGVPKETLGGRIVRFLFRHRPLETETAIYVLVSVLDYVMTYLLLNAKGRGGVMFNESNPVAAYFLWGWGPKKGLLFYKLLVVAAVCVATQLIAVYRLRLARLVLVFGIVVTLWVVVYSVRLYLDHAAV